MQELAGLSDVPDKLLLVSDRTLSILNDLDKFDAMMRVRYAKALYAEGYDPVVEGSPEASLVGEYVDALQLEVVPVSPDIRVLARVASKFVYQNYMPAFGVNQLVRLHAASIGGGNVWEPSAVPAAGQIYRLYGFGCQYAGGESGVLAQFGVVHGADECVLWEQNPMVPYKRYAEFFDLPVAAPDFPYVYVENLAAAESVDLTLYGILVAPEEPS